MRTLTANETRRTFLEFFEEHGHTVVPSSSLVPADDPTLLFTNAGMVQFKDTFLGLDPRPYTRAATAQKCLRVSGKHNDLDEVGPSPRHHTFFEMLGNFSFGDYFKEEAIRLAWTLLTEVLQLPKDRLWFTVFAGNDTVPADDEAARLWVKVGAPPERVLRFGEKDNFWAMGDTGPCGPCSEIHYYQGDDPANQRPEGVNSDDNDYMEIWNLVFMQYERDASGRLTPLPKPSIDTGMGFERLLAVLQGVRNNYDTDLFTPIIAREIELVGKGRADYLANPAPYRAVADHTRAIAFLIADGVLPGNEGRAYVLRRILRRAAYQGRKLGLTRPFLAETAEVVIREMGEAYPELRRRRTFILEAITLEEEQFGKTISNGLALLTAALDRLPPGGVLPGAEAFTLYDTYGFPLDLTERIAAERGMAVDIAGFAAAMEEQRERGRAAAQFRRGADADLWARQNLPATEFTGYGATAGRGTVLALARGGAPVPHAGEGQDVQVVLDRTPFYAESGGQVGDTGLLVGPRGRVRVNDTQKPAGGVTVHLGVVEQGEIAVGETVEARVDAERRLDIMRNHTATHLLHRALRDILGEHVAQAGSLVAPSRLRFDFTHGRPLTPDQLRQVEARINAWIRADTPVSWEITDYRTAVSSGAMALFGEKYGDRVRVVTVGCDDDRGEAGDVSLAVESRSHAPHSTPHASSFCSKELCGGTHVRRTGEIGLFLITEEGSVASGIRRIEALTGRAAEERAVLALDTVREASARLGVGPEQALARIDGLLAELKQRQHELNVLRAQAARGSLEALLGRARRADGVTTLVARVDAPDAARLREMGDWLRDKLGPSVVVLGAVLNDKPQVLAMVAGDLVGRGFHAGNLVKAIAPVMGGGGGGRPEMAQAGGRDASRLEAALAEAERLLAEQVGAQR